MARSEWYTVTIAYPPLHSSQCFYLLHILKFLFLAVIRKNYFPSLTTRPYILLFKAIYYNYVFSVKKIKEILSAKVNHVSTNLHHQYANLEI